MGFCEASVLHGPTTRKTIERVVADLMPIEVNVTPFERKKLAHPQTGARSHQHERSLS
jgi:hypothetical protein